MQTPVAATFVLYISRTKLLLELVTMRHSKDRFREDAFGNERKYFVEFLMLFNRCKKHYYLINSQRKKFDPLWCMRYFINSDNYFEPARVA